MKVIVVGAGRLGLKLVESLLNGNFEVILFDTNIRVIERVKERYDVMTIHASGLELGGIKELNVKSIDLLVATTTSDETNTLICTLAKKLGCKKTMARVRNPEITEHMEYLRTDLGVDHIINPEYITAREIARMLLKPFSLYSETFAKGKLSFVSIPARGMKDMVGRKVKDVRLSDALKITAISKDLEIITPTPETMINIEDTLFFAGLSPGIADLLVKYGSVYKRNPIKNVVIIGGGKTGYYLAKLLNRAKIQITVVEPNREKCNFIAERLREVLVINADGTDISLLVEEGLHKMDAFVGITNEDEKNILMSLVAKQYLIKSTITSINSAHYFQVINKIGLEGALSPVNVTIGSILKFIHGEKVSAIALIHGGKAEVTEILITEESALLGHKLNAIVQPEGLMVIGLERGQEVLLSHSDVVIQTGDQLVVFCLSSAIGNMEVLLRSKRGGFLDELFSHRQNNR